LHRRENTYFSFGMGFIVCGGDRGGGEKLGWVVFMVVIGGGFGSCMVKIVKLLEEGWAKELVVWGLYRRYVMSLWDELLRGTNFQLNVRDV
jgi:hypothetical protein